MFKILTNWGAISTSICLFLLSFSVQAQDCEDGMAGIYPCSNINLKSVVSRSELLGGILINITDGNDIWGWTSPNTANEYALVGQETGTVIVDITDAENPIIVAQIATATLPSPWRDIKVLNNHVYIGSEASNHHVQTYDLTQLDDLPDPILIEIPFLLEADGTATIGGSGNSHNIVVDETAGYMASVGTRSQCSGGLVFFDVTDPVNPTISGCYAEDNYTHDAVCFVYRGPDKEYLNKELCIAFNENDFIIIDATDKTAITEIGRANYSQPQYTHQGWISDDHRFLFVNDELDEQDNNTRTRTLIFDISDLSKPIEHLEFFAETDAIDHNLYIRGGYMYQSNYRAGLRIFDISDIENKNMNEVAFFDIYPQDDNASFNGAWSVYPYFNSNKVIINGIEQGLVVVEPQLPHFVMEKEGRGNVAIAAGAVAIYNINLHAFAYDEDPEVELMINDLPPEVTYTFTPENPKAGESTILTLLNTTNLDGNYSFTVEATEKAAIGRTATSPVHKMAFGLMVSGNETTIALELLDFNAKAQKTSNLVKWTTASETNTEWHIIERSVNGQDNWEVIGQIPAAGTSNQNISYQWIDKKPLEQSYYRLTTKNIDGSKDLSSIVLVEQNILNNEVQVYPNPTSDWVTVQYNATNEGEQLLEIVDVVGKIVYQDYWSLEQGLNYQQIMLSSFPKGMYYLKLKERILAKVVKK